MEEEYENVSALAESDIERYNGEFETHSDFNLSL